MELDKMKEYWKNQQGSTSVETNKKIVESMLSTISKGPVAIMKRNLKKELWFVSIGFSAAAFVFFVFFKGIMSLYSAIYIFLLAVFLLYYYSKNKLLSNMQCVTCEVKSNLTLQLNSLEKYIRKNLLYSTLVMPVFLMISALMLYLKTPTKVHSSVIYYTNAYPAWVTTLVWLGISVAVTIPLYYLNKKYLYWLYGKHIKKLRKMVEFMENE